MNIHCMALRGNAKRHETFNFDFNLLTGASLKGILEMTNKMEKVHPQWVNSFNVGHAGEKIVKILRCNFE